MKQFNYAKKRRQLRHLVKRFKLLSQNQQSKNQSRLDVLIRKIKGLVRELSAALAPWHLRKILGPAALLLGMSFGNAVEAQTFAPPEQNPFGLTPAYNYTIPAFADLDNDGDLDILAGEYYGTFQYYENTGTATNPQFAAPQENPFGLNTINTYLIFPAFADLDNDGDMDLLVGTVEGPMRYFRNTGTIDNPQFAGPQANPFGLVSTDGFGIPAFVDIDDDGDMDLLVGEYGGNMKFFRNTGTANAPQFAAPQTNPFGLVPTIDLATPAFADLDVDGDMDLLVGEYYGALKYFENTGSATAPQFAAPQENPFGLTSVDYISFPAFADLDNDGDMDLLVGEEYGDLQYFENTTSGVSTQEQLTGIRLEMFPNPTADELNIQTDAVFETIEAYDVTGKLVAFFPGSSTKINVSTWNSGTYFLKFTDQQGRYTSQRIFKE